MTYSTSSPITGAGQATAAKIEAWMAHKGRQLAPNFAPDRTYKAPPAGIGMAIIIWSQDYGVNHDIVAADIMHESAGWQSAIVRTKNNPSGLGATNDNPSGNAVTFATPADGCRATAAHMATYARGDGPWTIHDPRYTAVKQAGWLGIASSLGGLDGRWAHPGVGYGGRIAAAANDLLAFEGGEEPMSAQLPGFVWLPADSRHHTKGRTARIRGAAQHYSAGSDSRGWLTTNPNSNVSATCLVKHEPTMEERGWQLVALEDTPHTTAFANPYTAAIEYEHDGEEDIPDIAYEVLGATWADIERYILAHDLGDFSEGVKGHKVWVGNPKLTCPDGIDVSRVSERWQHYRGADAGNPLFLTGPDGKPWPFAFRRGFRSYVETVGRARYSADLNAAVLSVFGYPYREEYLAVDGNVYQPCERGTLQYIAGNDLPFDVVLLPCGYELPEAA